uniref:hypothetical protein n=1 Tax=Gemmiger formicilis TaxID=745368 RepID=UPI003FEF3B16
MRRFDRNKKTFCSRKFHSLLLTASVSMGMEYLKLDNRIRPYGTAPCGQPCRENIMEECTNVSLELFLLCLAYDLKKYWSKLQHRLLKTHLFPLKKE